MAATWKILAALALFLILPAGAYVTGAMVGPPTPPQDQRAQLVDQGGYASVPARKPKDRPSERAAGLVSATDDAPADVVSQEKSSAKPERTGAEKRRAEPKPAARPAADAPSEAPSPTESPEPSESPEPGEAPATEDPATDEPEPTESPAPTETPEPTQSDAPSPSVAPSDDPEDEVGS